MDKTHTTPQGTPYAATWDKAWAARVEQKETELGRPTCGAKTFAGTPCPLVSDHPSGRCAHHGGTDAIGAPIGNSNAGIHGLYARRLQRCGTHCPMWEDCPFAKPEILALDPPERPNCAYETAEYDAIIESLISDAESGGASSALAGMSSRNSAKVELGPPFIANGFRIHNLALLQVMVSRAAAALSVATFTDTVTSESDRYRLESTKVHAALEAFLRLSREHRATLAQYTRDVERVRKADSETAAEERPWSLADYVQSLPVDINKFMDEEYEAKERCEEYTRRLEWIAHDQLGAEWREFENIREFAVPRAIPDHGVALFSPGIPTDPPPPNEHPVRPRSDDPIPDALPP